MAGLYRNGFLVNAAGEILVTTDRIGAKPVSGFLRAPDGRLVVAYG